MLAYVVAKYVLAIGGVYACHPESSQTHTFPLPLHEFFAILTTALYTSRLV